MTDPRLKLDKMITVDNSLVQRCTKSSEAAMPAPAGATTSAGTRGNT